MIESLREVANQHDWYVASVGNLLYIGPLPRTRELATSIWSIQQTVRQLPPRVRGGWTRKTATAWNEIEQPRHLIKGWLSRSRVACHNVDDVPHDLWAGRSLPPMNLTQKLAIALAGFDLSFSLDNKGIVRIVPFEAQTPIRKSYRLPRQKRDRIEELDSVIPNARWKVTGAEVTVFGFVEDHQIVSEWIRQTVRSPQVRQRQSPRVNTNRQRFTLTVQEQRVDAILAAIAKQSQLKIMWNDSNGSLQSQRVSLSVREATLEELIDAVFKDLAASYSLDGQLLRVTGTSQQ